MRVDLCGGELVSDWYNLNEDGSISKTSLDNERDGYWRSQFNQKTDVGDAKVSTVFLGLDHSHTGPPPILFETLIFGGQHDGLMWRYCTRKSAEKGHAKVVQWLRDKAAGIFRDMEGLELEQ